MKIRLFLLSVTLSLMCSIQVTSEPSQDTPSTWTAIKEAAGQVKGKDVWESIKTICHALKLSFRAARNESKYDLEAEDVFLLTLFQTLFIERMYNPENVGMNVPLSYLEQAKQKGVQDFAYQLMDLPREPYLIERFGLFPFILTCTSFLATLCSYFGVLKSSPGTKPLLFLFLIAFASTTVQIILKIYRLASRVMMAYQGWIEDLLAQQKMASRGMRMR